MSHPALFYFPTFWHPLSGNGYQLWSGIMGALTIFTGFATTLAFAYRHLECHVEAPKNCHRLGHPVAGTGHRACRRHHPHASEKGSGITEAVIGGHHEEAIARAQGSYAAGSIDLAQLEKIIESALRHEREAEDKELDR